ncbi:MAG: hypothetical protein ABJ308_11560 [Halieaceae bacterium]
MTDTPVEYQVVVDQGVLPGQDRETVADALAALLEIDVDAARQYLDGSERTVKDHVDLSAAVTLQTKLKEIGLGASVELASDRVEPASAPESADLTSDEEPASEPESEEEPESLSEPEEEPEAEPDEEPPEEPESLSEPEAEPEAEPEEEPASEPEPEEEPASQTEPEEKPEVEPEEEPSSQFELLADPASEVEPEQEPESLTEPEEEEEPEEEPEAEPEEEPASEFALPEEPESPPEPEAEPEEEPEEEPASEFALPEEPESLSEPEAEPEVEPQEEPEQEPESEFELPEEPESPVEPEAEPEQEPASELELEPQEESQEEPPVDVEPAQDAPSPNLGEELSLLEEPGADAPELDLDQEIAAEAESGADSPVMDLDQELAAEAERGVDEPMLDLDSQHAAEAPVLQPLGESSDEPAAESTVPSLMDGGVYTSEPSVEWRDSTTPGSTMLCPSCKTVQPRAEKCESCGAIVDSFSEDAAGAAAVDRLTRASIVAAGVTAILATVLWLGLSRFLNVEVALFAWVIGGLVGLASAVTGSRGNKAGAVCAAMALVAILGGNLLLSPESADVPEEIPQPEPVVVWTEGEARAWYKDARNDADYYMTLDGSAAALRRFMVERDYTRTEIPAEIPDKEMQRFYQVDAQDLAWMVKNQPSFEQWSERMRGHMSGAMNASLDDSPAEPTRVAVSAKGFETMDLVFLFLGLATAFLLGRFGLKKGG